MRHRVVLVVTKNLPPMLRRTHSVLDADAEDDAVAEDDDVADDEADDEDDDVVDDVQLGFTGDGDDDVFPF